MGILGVLKSPLLEFYFLSVFNTILIPGVGRLETATVIHLFSIQNQTSTV